MKKTDIIYLINDAIGNRFRTNYGFITSSDLMLKNEYLIAFSKRELCDEYIKNCRMINCQSYGVTASNKMFHLSNIIKK